MKKPKKIFIPDWNWKQLFFVKRRKGRSLFFPMLFVFPKKLFLFCLLYSFFVVGCKYLNLYSSALKCRKIVTNRDRLSDVRRHQKIKIIDVTLFCMWIELTYWRLIFFEFFLSCNICTDKFLCISLYMTSVTPSCYLPFNQHHRHLLFFFYFFFIYRQLFSQTKGTGQTKYGIASGNTTRYKAINNSASMGTINNGLDW